MNDTKLPIVRVADDGRPMADSRDVAAYFERSHKNVLQSISNLHCSVEFARLNFQPFKIKDLAGESTSHVLMTKDGFTFLAMGFTGEKAAVFKESYIAEFSRMEAELRSGAADLAKLASDPAWLRGQLLAYTEKVMELKPKAAVADRIATADGSFNVTDAAKSLQIGPQALTRYLLTHGWVYRRPGSGRLTAYQDKLNSGHLEHKVYVQVIGGEERVRTDVRVMPKGLARIAAELNRKQNAREH